MCCVWCEQGLRECVVCCEQGLHENLLCGVNKDCMNVLYVL
jgi:hypothetical protein